MKTTVLAFEMFSVWEALVGSIILFAIPVLVATVFFLLLLRNKKENIRLRLEVGKLADELEKVRKQKSAVRDDSMNKSD
jgi:hypothetical protein